MLGEGTFLSLLWFIEEFAPDPATAAACRLAAQDEARHVAFEMAHLREHINARHIDARPSVREALANAVRRRHEMLRHTAGPNAEVLDSPVLMAAGSWEAADVVQGHDHVAALIQDMHEGRRKRLTHPFVTRAEAEELSSLQTRNFM